MKIKCFFIAIIAMLCSFADMRAERVMPTKPAPATLESGKTYYLYNVGTERLLATYASNDSYAGLNVTGRAAEITLQSNGAYTIKFTDNNYYLSARGSSNCYVRYDTNINSYCYWQITSVEGGYTINISPVNSSYYKEGNFVGAADAASQVVPNLTEGNIIWQLYEADEAISYYVSKKNLYLALEEAEVLGYNVDREEAIYNNPASTAEELEATAVSLRNGLAMSKGYTAPSYNEYPILFHSSDGSYGMNVWETWALPNNNRTGNSFCRYVSGLGTSTLTATITVDQLSTFFYEIDGSNGGCNLTVYVDGEQKRYLRGNALDCNYRRFFDVLAPGTHTISWQFTSTSTAGSTVVYVHNIACMKTPEISVELLEPGSLGTEVLYGGVNHIKNVRKLKVKGPMNSADWSQIALMDSLFELDLSEAEVSSIPEEQFDCYNSNKESYCPFLRKVVMPKSLQSIGKYAFRSSYVEEMIFPEGCKLTTIGENALRNTSLRELILPDTVSSIGEYAMYQNYYLEKASLGKVLTTVPKGCFEYCSSITQMELPNTITTVKSYAFRECHAMQLDSLPASLKAIGEWGFYGCDKIKIKEWPENLTSIGNRACAGWHSMDSIVIPSHVTYIGENAFENCNKLRYAELPSNFYNIPDCLFSGCTLETLVLKSASVATYNSSYLPASTGAILRVPDYLVNYYKQDSYWYNFKDIEGFGTEEVDVWNIHRPCVLDSHNRYAGNPDVNIFENGSLKISGALPMEINNFDVSHGGSVSGQLLSNCESIAIKGSCCLGHYTEANKWYFISLPFDMAVADIKPANGMQYAIRYYDGANRAANGASGSWKNYTAEDVVPAGTGFIYQTSINGWTGFYAVDNESKQNIVSYDEFTKMLAAHESENASNRGWNLVGNPYQTYYNNHYLNFTAPITVWNVSNKTYSAKSLIDDDYAISPNEAFFVQCPNEVSSISFPLGGRQLTNVIEDQNVQAKSRTALANDRQLIDITLAANGYVDETRVVFNEEALCGYELSCDASKFFSDDAAVPQLFTVGADGVQYAINERPMDNGIVSLAFYAPVSGSYTLSLKRCDAEHVYLTDHLNGTVTDLSAQDYTFEAEPGNINTRFSLSVVPGTTDIASISERSTKVSATEEGISIQGLAGTAEVFSADGRMVASAVLSGEQTTLRMPQGIYIVRAANRAYKVVIK
ncbi:MAG: leucine-rich repeat domain-containing protein [Prevotellaceae bacterium]|nr:leucine-rich repeat domain-containing protein [Prevotellaceae bacterium]